MGVTAWDARVFTRAMGAAALAFVLAWLVTAATDEGGIGWGARAGRALPLVPLCTAIGAWIGLAAARARGELRAFEALGQMPARTGAPAVGGAAAVVVLAAIAVASVPAVGVEGFYPAVPREQGFHLEGSALVDDAGEFLVRADGVPQRLVPPRPVSTRAAASVPAHGRAAAAIVTLVAGLALSLLVATRAPNRARWPSFVLAGVAVLATLIVLQAAAAHRVSVWWATAPPWALLAGAIWRLRASQG
jgi:hypothetical protein